MKVAAVHRPGQVIVDDRNFPGAAPEPEGEYAQKK
jgi:hypothetical protein